MSVSEMGDVNFREPALRQRMEASWGTILSCGQREGGRREDAVGTLDLRRYSPYAWYCGRYAFNATEPVES